MFTGIVEETGRVKAVRLGAASAKLEIEASLVLEGTKLGDSIATNGVCLTVCALTPTSYTADVMNETLRRSSLGELHAGDIVNLERAMAANGRFGGHIVSGHIDGTGAVRRIEADGNAVWYTIQADKKLLRYVVEKGSITIDGISLTVAAVDDDSFKVSVIPHTREVTNLKGKRPGSIVNLECDVIGKYVEKLVGLDSQNSSEACGDGNGLTMEALSLLG